MLILSGLSDDDPFRVTDVGKLQTGLGQELGRILRAHYQRLITAGSGDQELTIRRLSSLHHVEAVVEVV